MRRAAGIGAAAAALLAVLGAVDLLTYERPGGIAVEVPFTLRPLAWDEVPGWDEDAVGEAVPAFLASCEAQLARGDEAPANPVEQLGHTGHPTLAGKVADWREPCEVLATMAGGASEEDYRAAVEALFVPVEALADASLFTGYFEPSYPASETPRGRMTAPVLTRPEGLVTADLGAFKESLRGQDVVGRVVDGRLVPFEDAGTIAAAPPTDAEVLAYLDPNDLLFLQIQGSGRLVLEDGRVVRAGYAAKNGRPYVAVGKTLVADGAMPLEEVSMQSIEAWLDAAPPEEAARVRHSNPSYVFFRALELEDPSLGPLGAQGLPLTPGRSIAVDRRYYPMGLPVWLATDGTADNPALRRLMIAQDTGGAIRGPVRGDVFYGSDEAAARLAGTMKAEGRLILLLPQGLAARVTGAQAGA